MSLSILQLLDLVRDNDSPTSKLIIFSVGDKSPDYYIGRILCPEQNCNLREIHRWTYVPQTEAFIHLNGKYLPQIVTPNLIDRFEILDDVLSVECDRVGLNVRYAPTDQFDFREFLKRAFDIAPKDLWDYRKIYSDYWAELLKKCGLGNKETEK
jgi:hypothetical protein